MPISYEFNTIFVHIPKNAGTSIEKYLGMGSQVHLYAEKPLKETAIKYDPKAFLRSELYEVENVPPQHLTLAQLQKIIPSDIFSSFYKFSVIRNPFDRLVSEYLYVKNNTAQKFQPYKQLSFIDFIDAVFTLSEKERLSIFDGHFNTQKSFITIDGEIAVDDLFSMSDLTACETKLKQITKSTRGLPHARSSGITDYLSYYADSDYIRNFITEKYAEDFELMSLPIVR